MAPAMWASRSERHSSTTTRGMPQRNQNSSHSPTVFATQSDRSLTLNVHPLLQNPLHDVCKLHESFGPRDQAFASFRRDAVILARRAINRRHQAAPYQILPLHPAQQGVDRPFFDQHQPFLLQALYQLVAVPLLFCDERQQADVKSGGHEPRTPFVSGPRTQPRPRIRSVAHPTPLYTTIL